VEFLTSDRALNVSIRTTINYAGLYFPVFVIQLNAIKNGVIPQLAFYTVRWTLTRCLDIARLSILLLRLSS